MHLHRFEYSEHQQSDKSWAVKPFELDDVGLFVGQNATGKTRLLNCIAGLGTMLSRPPAKLFVSGSWHVQFVDSDNQFDLILRLKDHRVQQEKLVWNGKLVLNRGIDGRGSVWSDHLSQYFEFAIDETSLALVVKRDAIQHAYLDMLRDWGAGVRHYLFGGDFGRTQLALIPVTNEPSDLASLSPLENADSNDVVSQYVKGYKKFGKGFDEVLKKDLRRLGYKVTAVNAIPAGLAFEGLPVISGDKMPTILEIRETGVKCPVRQHEISAGMFRALALLVHLNFAVMSEHKGTLIIDDVGEGLDYGRSSALVELLVEKAISSHIQVFISSNDRFVMNHVDLKYWQMLTRRGSTLTARNRFSDPEPFKRFEYTGLSNFDFFTNSAKLP